MTREIKFRAWDKKENCWVGGFCIHESGLFSNFWSPTEQKPIWWTDSETQSRIVIQQYTGLRDKNSKEIYEGDIIHYDATYYGAPNTIFRTSAVKYQGNEFIPHHINNATGYAVEVIGNIYGTPALLKEDTNGK